MEKFRDEEYVKMKAAQASEKAASPEELKDILPIVSKVFASGIQFEKVGSLDMSDESGLFTAETSFSVRYDSFISEGFMKNRDDATTGSIHSDDYRRITEYIIKSGESEVSLPELVPQGWSIYIKVDKFSEKPMGISSHDNKLIISYSHPLSLSGLIVLLHESNHAQRQSDPGLEDFNKHRRLARKKKNTLQPISATEAGLILEDEREADAFVIKRLKHLLKPEYLEMVKKLLYRSEDGYGRWLTQVPFEDTQN